ncbi:MAG: RIP metalloprotease RseP [Candidatus Delongbacteria bacterium]|nr:RIP metalloprotease RseP [Candidatus Delongbacteria bacterium]
MLTLISFIVLLGIIVFIHEAGHFTAAKLCGMRVETFSLGFGRALIKKQWGETEYRIAWIPLGGYVKISGMIDESLEGESLKGEPWEFESKNFFQKSFVILAGVTMNFILAIFIYSLITFANGIPEVNSTHIKGFSDDSPAREAGMTEGDVILEINNSIINTWQDITDIVHASPEKELIFKVSRNDSILLFPITTMSVRTLYDGEIKDIGLIGIYSDVEIRDASLLESIAEGSKATWGWIKIGWLSIKMLVTGQASVKELGGPLMIAQMTGESVRAGIWSYLAFIAFISVNIGFLNLLPVPILDGGHFVFILIEGISRKKIPPKIKFKILQIGMLLLFLLMAIVIFNDAGRLFNGTSENETEEIQER